jgi:hypothetical protein
VTPIPGFYSCAAGRPALTGTGKVSLGIKVRVPQGMKVKSDREAKTLGVTPSALIRQA